jgi:hypothetical protein
MQPGTLKKLAVGAVVLAGAGFLFWEARWYVFQTRINNVLVSLPVKPSIAQLGDIRGRISEQARALWISPDSMALDIHLEQHGSNGFAAKEDMTEFYWFVVVHARRGSSTADWERRIDSKLEDADVAALEAKNVEVQRRAKNP